ncbi:MAG: acyl-CoA dehydrogenase [Mycobacterium sp.]|nr:acyl-CoA dehydrogenase [Mycobacterium sp.]
MSFDLTPTIAQHDLARRTHEFAEQVVHVDLEPSGGPFNAMLGRGTPARTQLADTAMSMRDRVPRPVMQLAMKVLRPPKK